MVDPLWLNLLRPPITNVAPLQGRPAIILIFRFQEIEYGEWCGGGLVSVQTAVLKPISRLPTSGMGELEVNTQLPEVGRWELNFRPLEDRGWKSEVDI